MIELRKLLQAYLPTLHPRVYYTEAPVDAQTPYIVYSFQASFTGDESTETMLIDIEGWDIPVGGDSTVIEELMETIKGDGSLISDPTGLDEKTLSNTKITANFRFESRLTVPDEDKAIKHILHNYQVSIFERSS